MTQSTQQAVVVARVSFESTRLSPPCLAETYARIVPITREVVRAGARAAPERAAPEAAAQPATTRRAEHG
jgi:hypothetical protein